MVAYQMKCLLWNLRTMVGQPLSALNVFTWSVEFEMEISAENLDLHLS